MARVLVLNGPNLNLLGSREVDSYGADNLDQIREYVGVELGDRRPEWEWFQTNGEGELIDRIHRAIGESWDGLVINPGGLAHTSVALLDALRAYPGLKIEVHLTNTGAREGFRARRLSAGGVHGVIEGLGRNSYLHAVREVVGGTAHDRA